MRLKEFNRGNYSFETGKQNTILILEFAEDYDRFQWIDGHTIQTGVNRTSSGTPGTDANSIIKAEATIFL
jgi:Fe(3+) dicitrate transport protein